MGPVMASLSVGAGQADALSGCSGCPGRVTQEFGDHPETAVARMRWARAVAAEAFVEPVPGPGPGAGRAGSVAGGQR